MLHDRFKRRSRSASPLGCPVLCENVGRAEEEGREDQERYADPHKRPAGDEACSHERFKHPQKKADQKTQREAQKGRYELLRQKIQLQNKLGHEMDEVANPHAELDPIWWTPNEASRGCSWRSENEGSSRLSSKRALRIWSSGRVRPKAR